MKGNIEIEVAVEAEHVKRTMKEYAEKVLFPQKVEEWASRGNNTIIEARVIHWYCDTLVGFVKHTVPTGTSEVLLYYKLAMSGELVFFLDKADQLASLISLEDYFLSKL